MIYNQVVLTSTVKYYKSQSILALLLFIIVCKWHVPARHVTFIYLVVQIVT